MRRLQPAGGLDRDVESFLQLERPLGDFRLDTLAVDQRHHQERLSVGFVDFKDRADVGMIECRGRLRVAKETRSAFDVFHKVRRQELDRDRPAEPRIFGLINDAHSPLTKLPADPVAGDGLAIHGKIVVSSGEPIQ